VSNRAENNQFHLVDNGQSTLNIGASIKINASKTLLDAARDARKVADTALELARAARAARDEAAKAAVLLSRAANAAHARAAKAAKQAKQAEERDNAA